MDDRRLLGFFNPITELYPATPVLRLLLAARDHSDQPDFVILDEMNLAKVEYYFSDFLSSMESRTNGQPEGQPLLLHDPSSEPIVTQDGLPIPAELTIPRNVLFTGTVTWMKPLTCSARRYWIAPT